MGILKNLFSKKKVEAVELLNIKEIKEKGVLGDAEKIANIVAAGIENENYSGMHSHLAAVTSKESNKEQYVFEHPPVTGKFFAITICSILSLIFADFLIVGIGTMILSSNHLVVGSIVSCASGVLLVINLILVYKYIDTIRFKARFDLYEELIGFRQIEFVEELTVYIKKTEIDIVKDLQRAIKEKLIPQGHFSRDNLVFMVSDSVYDRYLEKSTVYDRYFQKTIEERRRVKSRTEYINQIIEMGTLYVEKINGFSSLIKDKIISKEIATLGNVVSMIFHEIDANPHHAQSLGVFLNYYLPTTEKLLDAYVTLGEKQIPGNNLNKTKKDIEESLNTIIIAFEGILEKIYEEQEMDIVSDIEAMELSMKQEELIL